MRTRVMDPFLGVALNEGVRRKKALWRPLLLFFHGDRDQIIPLKLGRSLFEVAPEPKCFIEVPAAGHNDLVARVASSYRERLRGFYGHLQ